MTAKASSFMDPCISHVFSSKYLGLHGYQIVASLSLPMLSLNRFDHVLVPTHSQSTTYDVVASGVIDEVLKGFNGAVMCYGQTGTGKTYTMFGKGDHIESSYREPLGESHVHNQSTAPMTSSTKVGIPQISSKTTGIVPRAVHDLVNHVNSVAVQGVQVQLTFSFLEIYCETISDLLRPATGRGMTGRAKSLQIREDPVHGIYVAGLTQVIAGADAEDVVDTIDAAASYRATHATAQNNTSSRSHALLQFTIEQCVSSDAERSGDPEAETVHVNLRRSTLTLVDLAGSERVAKSRSDGRRLEEAKKINKSISALGNCVAALAEGRPGCHVPFRDSKLTRILTDTLGGNAKSCICANISPASVSFEETNSTLIFASRSMAVRHHAVVNEMVLADSKGECAQMLNQQARATVNELLERNAKLESEMKSLRRNMLDKIKPISNPPPPPGPVPTYGDISIPPVNDKANLDQPLVEELSATIESLQQQLAQKNLQIAQLQQQNRKYEMQESPSFLSRVAKSLAEISPLRTHLRDELV
jgi:hypothetical protein